MDDSSRILRMAQALFVLNGIVWVFLAVLTVERGGGFGWALAGMMVANGVMMLLAAWGIAQGVRSYYLLAAALVVVNLVLTITDQFGPLDLAILAINVILLGLLVGGRKRILGREE